MMDDELKVLRKKTAKAKRIASEKASELHDLVEDRLPAAYEEIPQLSEECYQACLEWAKANEEFQNAQSAN